MPKTRLAAQILVFAVVTLGLARCGGSDTISTQKVIDTFHAHTGAHLLRQTSRPDWDSLNLDDDINDTQQTRLGAFTIYVLKAKGDDREFLRDDAGKLLHPDGDGLYWEFTKAGDDFWTATKLYAHGRVVLQWVGGARRGDDLGAPFERTDTALSALDP